MSRSKQPGPAASAGEVMGAVLKLASALCGLVAVGLFILPLLRGEVTSAPRLITLGPSTSGQPSNPVEEPPAKEPPAAEPAEEPAPEQATREQRAAFKGAILSLESQPSGARVRVNGIDQGETPVSLGLDCAPGTTLVAEFTLRGFEKTTHRTPCPKDSVVTVTARMRKGSGKSAGKR